MAVLNVRVLQNAGNLLTDATPRSKSYAHWALIRACNHGMTDLDCTPVSLTPEGTKATDGHLIFYLCVSAVAIQQWRITGTKDRGLHVHRCGVSGGRICWVVGVLDPVGNNFQGWPKCRHPFLMNGLVVESFLYRRSVRYCARVCWGEITAVDTTMLFRSTVLFLLSTLGCIKYVACNLATRLSNEKVCFRYLEIHLYVMLMVTIKWKLRLKIGQW